MKRSIARDLVVEIVSRLLAYGGEAALLAGAAHLALPQVPYWQAFGVLFIVSYLLGEKVGRGK